MGKEHMTPRTTASRSAASHRAPRKTRRDAGATRLKTRDIDIVRFGDEQTFVRFDTLGEYLAPNYAPALAAAPPEQLADRTAPTKRAWPADLRHRLMAVSHLMRRLEAQGYVEIIQPWADQPAWFRVTAQGLHLLDLDWQEIPFPAHLPDQEARLRHEVNEHLLQMGGHIGYDIRPSRRRQGYGKLILKYGLDRAKILGLERVLLTCDEDNLGSRRIIESHAGMLENIIEVEQWSAKVCRYWIHL